MNTVTELTFAREIVEKLDGWVNDLARPLVPPKMIPVGDNYLRLEFRQHLPHSVMVGKLVRAVSGIRAAQLLAENGYITESGSVLRMVSDFCTEVNAIGRALHRGGELPKAVAQFIDQYFQPKALTPEEYEKSERVRYVGREALMKGDLHAAANAGVDGEKMRQVHRYLNMAYDAYVHGAYETAMELCEPRSGVFVMRGHPDPATRYLHEEAVVMKLHEVVTAIEITAGVTANTGVFEAARTTRREMDTRTPWKRES